MEQEELDILKQGIEVWNRWRGEHPDILPDLRQANLRQANLHQVNLRRADLSEADLSGADLSEADLSGANLEETRSLKDTNLRGVKGLTKEQLEACKAKGAIIDEVPPTSPPQPPVSPPVPLQSNGTQAQSAPTLKKKQGVLEATPTAVNDTPKDDVSQDRLNFAPYVDALYKFITAEETTAPLAISINGAWGAGKSSLMRMLMQRLEPTDRKRWAMHWQSLAWYIGRDTWLTRLLLQSEEDLRKREKLSESIKQRKPMPAPYFPTVWFNAWKFSEEEQIWSALALEVTNQLNEKKYTFLSRFLFWLHLTQRRLNYGRLILSLLPLFFLLATVIYQVFILPSLKQGTVPSVQTIAPWGGSILGVATVVTFFTTLFNAVKRHPFKVDLKGFFNPPNYQEKVGYIGRFNEDFKQIVDAVTHLWSEVWQTQKLVVFIDDLDRCRPLQVVGIIEAISLFLDSEQCIFVLGMDPDAIVVSIETKYKELMEKIRHGDPSIVSPGSLFLQKIIQISLNVPQPKDAYITGLIRDILKASPQGETPDQDNRPPEVPPDQDNRPPEVPPDQDNRPPEVPPEYFQKKDVQKAIEYTSKLLKKNPRQVKRFVNLFRLKIYLGQRELEGENLNIFAVSVVWSLLWPEVNRLIFYSIHGAEICSYLISICERLQLYPDEEGKWGGWKEQPEQDANQDGGQPIAISDPEYNRNFTHLQKELAVPTSALDLALADLLSRRRKVEKNPTHWYYLPWEEWICDECFRSCVIQMRDIWGQIWQKRKSGEEDPDLIRFMKL